MAAKMLSRTDRVTAVIVTYNRPALLRRCVTSVLQQTHAVFRIIVIDNNGADDARAALSHIEDERLRIIRLPHNIGGAGGFHIGVEVALASGADAIWLMDDDGFASPECLGAQLSHSEKNMLDVSNPLVLDEEAQDRLSSSLKSPAGNTITSRQEAQAFDIIGNEISPFNGTLFTTGVIARIGNIDYTFFMWGDEIDFVRRVRRAGLKMATVTAAVFYHPRQRSTYARVPLIGAMPLVRGERGGFFVRNRVLLTRRYRGVLPALFEVIGFALVWAFAINLRSGFSALRYGLDTFTGRKLAPAADHLRAQMETCKRSQALE